MNSTIIIEAAGLFAGIIALYILLTHSLSDKTFDSIRIYFCALLLTACTGHIISIIEWSGVSDSFDYIADFSNYILSLLWIVFFYTCLHTLSQKKIAESERLFRTLISNITDVVTSLDIKGRILYISPSVSHTLGYAPKQLIGQNAFSYVHKKDLPRIRGLFQKMIDAQTTEKTEFSIRHKNNTWHIVEATGKYMEHSHDDAEMLITLHDVTEQRKARTAQEIAEQRLNYLLDFNPAIIYTSVLRDEFVCSFVSENFYDLTGYRAEEMINQKGFWRKHVHPDDKGRVTREIARAMNRGLGSFEYRFRHKDGSYFWIIDTFKITYDKDGSPLEVVGAWTDTTSLHQLSDKLAYQEKHDVLTGASNRFEFERQLTVLISSSLPGKTNHVVCEIDLDQFKIINDNCGHVAGNELLKQIADILRETIRDGDLLGRLGGDEFGILMKNCNINNAENITRRWLKKINDYRFEWEGKKYHISASIGLVPITDTAHSATEILSKTNIACLAAKERGRNRIHVYDVADIDTEKMHGELRVAGEIHQALEENRFRLYWQPIVPVVEPHKKTQYEILIRMLGTDGNIVSPGLFLPAAEKYGLSTRVDLWVINTLFSMLEKSTSILDDIHYIDINLSGQSVGNEEIFRTIASHLKKKHIPSNKICFEITETAVVSHLQEAVEFMKRLKEYGCQFSLDDFGSGLSSFAYLKTLPVDFIKIDGSFVKDIADDEIDFAFVKSITEIGRVMGKQTIAEFVENEIILAKLQHIGVDFAQGYGIGMPVPVDEKNTKN